MTREMKDSGVEWIGKIPVEWEISKIGSLYVERKTKVSDVDHPPLSVTKRGILPQLETAAKTEAHDDRKLVCKGDFVINSRSDRRGSCGISVYEGSVSLINTILSPRKELNPKYYDRLFHCPLFSDEFYKWGHGIVDDLWTTNWQDMKNIYIPTPPLEKQIEISTYLDRQCAELDAVMEKTCAKIEECKKLKQAVITQAVTHGVRGARPMKDSGIEWIGEIPVEWETSKIGSLYVERKTKVSDVDYPPLSVTKKGILPQLETAAKTEAHDDRKLVCKGDFAINSRSDRRGSCGISAYEGSVSLINTILSPRKEMNPEYYDRLFHCSLFSDEFYKWGHGIVDDLWTTNWQDMKNIYIPSPPLEEQIEISTYLDRQCGEIDALIAKEERRLAEIETCKKSLIYETVTGKREVE